MKLILVLFVWLITRKSQNEHTHTHKYKHLTKEIVNLLIDTTVYYWIDRKIKINCMLTLISFKAPWKSKPHVFGS